MTLRKNSCLGLMLRTASLTSYWVTQKFWKLFKKQPAPASLAGQKVVTQKLPSKVAAVKADLKA